MKRLYYLFLSLAVVCLLGACTETEGENDDSELAESLVGLWYGESKEGAHHVLDLRADRTGVSSYYFQLRYLEPGIQTNTFDGWKAADGQLTAGYDHGSCGFGKLELVGSTGHLYELGRIYSPSTDYCNISMARLTGRTWTGFYEDKIITLEFHEDGTMTRTDSPNAGGSFEATVQTSGWSVSDNVIRFGDFLNAWGVTVEKDVHNVIFVDFGDAASAFTDYAYASL